MSIARRLLAAAVRKMLPKSVPDNPGVALALRSGGQLTVPDRNTHSPIAHSSSTVYTPPKEQPAPPRRRRRIVIVEEITRRF